MNKSGIESLRAEVAELRRLVYELRAQMAQPQYVPPPVYGPCRSPLEQQPMPNEHFRVWCNTQENPYASTQQ
jgi:hypothetical protein